MQRNIELPPLHNKRVPEQWKVINKHVDFEGKSVWDIGCGYADLLWCCWRAGAMVIMGVDCDIDTIKYNKQVRTQMGDSESILYIDFCRSEIETLVGTIMDETCEDIILCFSVLPYLDNIPATLQWIHDRSKLALIECQTFGDGPGPAWHKTDDDMRHLLECTGWTSINRIGATYVANRDKWRTIWLCENKEAL